AVSESPHAIQTQKRGCAPHRRWRLAKQDAGGSGPRDRNICGQRRRTSEADGVAREFGGNYPTRNRSSRHGKGQQGHQSDPRLAETVASARSKLAAGYWPSNSSGNSKGRAAVQAGQQQGGAEGVSRHVG